MAVGSFDFARTPPNKTSNNCVAKKKKKIICHLLTLTQIQMNEFIMNFFHFGVHKLQGHYSSVKVNQISQIFNQIMYT